MYIHQIYINDSDDDLLPDYFKSAVNTVITKIPHTQHQIWGQRHLRGWIADNYGANMLSAFDKLKPYAYKADLARYLLLWHFGGWYFDISIRVINGVAVNENVDFITFLDFPQYSSVSFACSNGIIYSKPKNPLLKQLINNVYANIKNEFYGKNSLYITGPVVLGKSVAMFEETQNIITGNFIDLTPGFQNKNRAFVFNNGLLMALHKDGNMAGDLKKFGASGTNNYRKFYDDRNVFDQSILLPNYTL